MSSSSSTRKSLSRSSSRKSSSRSTSKHSITSLERRQKEAINKFKSIPHRSPIDTLKKNRKAKTEVERQNRSELDHFDVQVRTYFKTIVPVIRAQLNKVGSLLYKIQYTNEHPVPWTHRDLSVLKMVKQTLMNALHLIIYPKDKHPSLYTNSLQIIYARNELIDVNPFFEPVIKEIQTSLRAISNDIYKMLYPAHGKISEYTKKVISQLQEAKQQLLDLFNSLPYMGMSIRLVNDNV